MFVDRVYRRCSYILSSAMQSVISFPPTVSSRSGKKPGNTEGNGRELGRACTATTVPIDTNMRDVILSEHLVIRGVARGIVAPRPRTHFPRGKSWALRVMPSARSRSPKT